eukprot:3369544-Alexandrium_andersonii.AAC.1
MCIRDRSNSLASTHDPSGAPDQGRSLAWPWARTYPSCACPPVMACVTCDARTAKLGPTTSDRVYAPKPTFHQHPGEC